MTLNQGLNLLAGPFVSVGDDVGDINSCTSDDLGEGSVAQFWNSTAKSYSTVFYYPTSVEGGIYDENDNCLGAGWGDADQVVVEQNLERGEGYWIQATGTATVTFSGEVNTNSTSVVCVTGLNLLGNPYPKTIDIQDVKSADLGEGSVAQFWDSNLKNYTTVFYYPTSVEGGIYDEDDNCLGAGWGDSDQIIVNRAIAPGEGFWIQATGEAEVSTSF